MTRNGSLKESRDNRTFDPAARQRVQDTNSVHPWSLPRRGGTLPFSEPISVIHHGMGSRATRVRSQQSGMGTVVLIAAAVIGGGYWFLTQYDHMTILNRAGAHPVSDALKDRAEAGPLSTMSKSIPEVITARKSAALRSRVQATGLWTYVVHTNRGTFTLSHAAVESSGANAGLRIEQSFREQWFRTLQHSGYFSGSGKRPPHMRVSSFVITTPEGTEFKVEKDQNTAQLLVNLAAILGCQEFDGLPEHLMAVERGSLAHAIAFSGLHERLSLQDKLRLSCHENPQVRQFAAEMLASHLPRWPTTAMPLAFRASAYRGIIAQLSTLVPLSQKERIFRGLVREDSTRP